MGARCLAPTFASFCARIGWMRPPLTIDAAAPLNERTFLSTSGSLTMKSIVQAPHSRSNLNAKLQGPSYGGSPRVRATALDYSKCDTMARTHRFADELQGMTLFCWSFGPLSTEWLRRNIHTARDIAAHAYGCGVAS